MQFNCSHCGKETNRPAGHVNRSINRGDRLYCSRECSGLGRRTNKTSEQRKEEKRLYDVKYRSRDVEARKARKADYYARTKDRVKEAEARKKRMPKHIEYCRRPEYVEWKKKYDRQYRAHKHYGEFADCFLLVMDIRDECLTRMTDYEIRLEKGTLSKTQKRKRDYERTIRNNSEECTLGNLERGEGGQNGRLASRLNRFSSPRNSPYDKHSA